jgi:hypothetical protein
VQHLIASSPAFPREDRTRYICEVTFEIRDSPGIFLSNPPGKDFPSLSNFGWLGSTSFGSNNGASITGFNDLTIRSAFKFVAYLTAGTLREKADDRQSLTDGEMGYMLWNVRFLVPPGPRKQAIHDHVCAWQGLRRFLR